MRPGEILGLRTGCSPDPVPGPDGQPGRHLIRGREYKTATDENGNHQSGGAEREAPWVAITPVVNAIRVLERMVPEGCLLFDHNAHDLPFSRAGTGSLKVSALRDRMEDFAAWANHEAARHGLPGEVIPADPHGSINLMRFRRSLAWHIARRPGGLVALAIQYGHMRTAFDWASEGYGSRSRNGIHDLIDLETARAVADTVTALHDDLANGGGISGPAARRAIRAAAAAPRFDGTPITLASARRLLANEDAMIYDNPHALVLCHYKRDKALCHRGEVKDAPASTTAPPASTTASPAAATSPAPISRPPSSATARLPWKPRPRTSRSPSATGCAPPPPGSATKPASTTAPASPPERTPDDPGARRARADPRRDGPHPGRNP